MMKLNLGEEVHLFDEMLLHGGLRIVGKVMKKRNEMMKSLLIPNTETNSGFNRGYEKEKKGIMHYPLHFATSEMSFTCTSLQQCTKEALGRRSFAHF